MVDPDLRLPHRRPVETLVGAVIVCEVVGASGAVFTAPAIDTWYAGLVLPSIAPPNWVFGPVWTVLFALLGVAVWLIWRRGVHDGAGRLALGLFVGQFVLNLAWSAAFFGLRSPAAGLAVIIVLWVAIVATIVAFDRVDRRGALLLGPYLVWVSFAAILNYQIWRLN